MTSRKQIAVLHLDLGVGGAERLVVDSAVALQNKGHDVKVYTTHCSPSHSFSETQDGTLSVRVYGDWLPRHIFGFATVLCAYLRMLWLTIVVCMFQPHFDVFFLDGVSFTLPLIRLLRPRSRCLFYCHFPDSLLCVDRRSWLKRIYRVPFDWVEEVTTGKAELIMVNSKFTRSMFTRTFQRLHHCKPVVLYPPINLQRFDENIEKYGGQTQTEALLKTINVTRPYFLSLNRYERKKMVQLLLQAAAEPLLKDQVFDIVVAGGYDEHVAENREYAQELAQEAESLGVNVIFRFSISDAEKTALLSSPLCIAVVYTPTDEHFGIVPVEAMYCRRPVIACNSGGPLESIRHEETGFLCDPTPSAFAKAMHSLHRQYPHASRRMGEDGRKLVASRFSLSVFADHLDSLITQPTPAD